MKVSNRFRKCLTRSMITFIFCAAPVLIITFSASGRPFRLSKIPDQGKNFGCQTCHVSPRGGSEFTAFGADYKKIGLKAGDKYNEELGKLDSDGDGYTNDDEFKAGSNPGDPKSKP
jgi:hypothetical protein